MSQHCCRTGVGRAVVEEDALASSGYGERVVEEENNAIPPSRVRLRNQGATNDPFDGDDDVLTM